MKGMFMNRLLNRKSYTFFFKPVASRLEQMLNLSLKTSIGDQLSSGTISRGQRQQFLGSART